MKPNHPLKQGRQLEDSTILLMKILSDKRRAIQKTKLQNKEKKIDKTTKIRKRMKDNEEKKIHIFITLLPFLHSLWREPAGGKVIKEETDNKDKM